MKERGSAGNLGSVLDLIPGKGRTVVVARSSFNGAPPIWFGMVFIVLGIAVPSFILVGMFSQLPSMLNNPLNVLMMIPIIGVGSVFVIVGGLCVYFSRHIPKTVKGDKLGASVGMSGSEFREAARQCGIRPRYKIEDVDYYDPADFDQSSLLRGSMLTELYSDLPQIVFDQVQVQSLLMAVNTLPDSSTMGYKQAGAPELSIPQSIDYSESVPLDIPAAQPTLDTTYTIDVQSSLSAAPDNSSISVDVQTGFSSGTDTSGF